MDRNYYTLVVGLLGALKLALESFGVHVIDNGQIDAVANGIAAIVAVAGVAMSHVKKPAPVAVAAPVAPATPAANTNEQAPK